jgi:hypothetical protein
MKATVSVEAVKEPTYLTVQGKRWWNSPARERGPDRTVGHQVVLDLQLSEAERGTILAYQIQLLSLEDRPKWTFDELERLAHQQENFIKTTKTETMRTYYQSQLPSFQEREKERVKVEITEYMISPYIRRFESITEAHDYAEKLKTEILPTLKDLIEKYRDRKSVETLEL